MTARCLMVAAPRSGAGKTTVTLAILSALRRRGLRVRAAKAGPDYIDPAFHAAATGAPCINLDSWAMPPPLLDALFGAAAAEADVLVVESAMGLFDGVAGPAGGRGTAADLAARFALPVLLVLDVSGQSQSAAAVARGFAMHEPGVRVSGVVLNRLGSDRHRNGIVAAMAATGLPVRGALRRDATMALPERHLGLVQAREHLGLAGMLDRLAELGETSLDLDGVLADAGECAAPRGAVAAALPPPGQRIAVADDAAFSFFYPHLANGWRSAGAELVAFSPLADEAPPDGCDACWLPGGYPELHAGTLAAAARFRDGLARFARTHPVHGECGGYMMLGEALQDAGGTWHRMAGLLGHTTSFARRRLILGYRQARLLQTGILGYAGTMLRGHEFHYAAVADPGLDSPLAMATDAHGDAAVATGGRRGPVSGTFFHVIAARQDHDVRVS